jgi:hypothetical protein
MPSRLVSTVAQTRVGGDVVDQRPGGGLALLGLVFGQDRHEGLRKRAFAEQPAQQVGQAEGDVEGVGVGRGAEMRGRTGCRASRPVMRDSIVMLEMAARVRSRFIAGDYSWAIAARKLPGVAFCGASGHQVNLELLCDETFAIIEGCIEFSWQTLIV